MWHELFIGPNKLATKTGSIGAIKYVASASGTGTREPLTKTGLTIPNSYEFKLKLAHVLFKLFCFACRDSSIDKKVGRVLRQKDVVAGLMLKLYMIISCFFHLSVVFLDLFENFGRDLT